VQCEITRNKAKQRVLLDGIEKKSGSWTVTFPETVVPDPHSPDLMDTWHKKPENSATTFCNNAPETQGWREELYRVITKEVTAYAFERLTQRLLRESGFVQVEVTGRTGDGGIDGKGIAKIHGFMSFHVIFQCKKYQGSVSAGDIRDFRGAKATYISIQKHWKIFWRRADLKWHGYKPDLTVATIEKFLEVVNADEYGCFFGLKWK
jgi:hypothetical protein